MIFYASSKENDTHLLNEYLLSGPNLNSNTLTIILKFREYNIAFIEEAFLQIDIGSKELKDLKMCHLLFSFY